MFLQLIPMLILLPLVLGRITVPTSEPETRPDLLELYDARRDEFLGLKIASLPAEYVPAIEMGGPMKEQSFLLQTEYDYMKSMDFEGTVELNSLIYWVSGKANAAMKFDKFGHVESDSAVGLLIFERTTKVSRIDLCSSEVFDNLNKYSSFPTGVKPTHVVAGFRYGARVEIGIKFQNVINDKRGMTVGKLQVEIDALLGAVTGTVDYNSTRFSTGVFRLATITVHSTVNLNIPRPITVQEIPKFYAAIRAKVESEDFPGNVTGVVLEKLNNYAPCLDIQSTEYTYPLFPTILANVTHKLVVEIDSSKKGNEEYYDGFLKFSDCFSVEQQDSVHLGAAKYYIKYGEIKEDVINAMIQYRTGNLSRKDYFQNLCSISDRLFDFKKEQRSSSYGFQKTTQSKLDLLDVIGGFNVSCWSAEKRAVTVSVEASGGSVKAMLYNSSSDNFIAGIPELNKFGSLCFNNFASHTCYIVDCSYRHDLCTNHSGVVNVNSDWPVPNHTYQLNQLQQALVFMFNRTSSSEYIISKILDNVVVLSDVAVLANTMNTSSLKDIRGLQQYFRNLNSVNVTALDRFIGKQIIVVP